MTPVPTPALQPWLVVVNLPVPAQDFSAPHGWSGGVPTGCRVLVPWRGELVVGLVVGETEPRGAYRLREAVQVLDAPACPWVPPQTVQGVCAWATDARIPAGLIWGDLLGVGWTADSLHTVRAVEGADLSAFARKVPTTLWTDAGAFHPALLDAVREQGLLEERFEVRPRTRSVVRARELAEVPAAARAVTILRAVTPPPAPLTPRQTHAHAWLAEHGPQDSLSGWAKAAGVSASVVTGVLNAGGAQYVSETAPLPPAGSGWRRPGHRTV